MHIIAQTEGGGSTKLGKNVQTAAETMKTLYYSTTANTVVGNKEKRRFMSVFTTDVHFRSQRGSTVNCMAHFARGYKKFGV